MFKADQFVDTEFYPASVKAKFANRFVHFLSKDFPKSHFGKWLYKILSSTFGHIAHYNQEGFYSNFFLDTAGKVSFLRQIDGWRCPGDPAFCFSDVEQELQRWVRGRGLLETYLQKMLDEKVRNEIEPRRKLLDMRP